MSKQKTPQQLAQHKDSSLAELDAYVNSLISSANPREQSQGDKLAYWISDYARFLKKEQTFNSSKIISYKRGDIINVHLGYRLGSEEGGLHFGLVIDVNNAKKSNTITIIPLTSQKLGKAIHKNSVDIGDELFKLIISKHDSLSAEIKKTLHDYEKELLELDEQSPASDDISKAKLKIETNSDLLAKKSRELDDIRKSVLKMKSGSVALVNQITTVSKLRIYDPVYAHNVLYGIKLSPTILANIDRKIAELYIDEKNIR